MTEAKAIKAPGAGVQTLNGEQAVSYCRVRDIDNAIYRDGRQRKVILSVKEYPKVIETFRPFVTTNIGNVVVLQQFIFDDINMNENKYLNDNSKIELNY